ncbi:YheC/YheD family protein [Bacillus sp. H-16]|uniref:YheC/YheD family protein n=1 Tax=Alteribacter salitolerans TaxID=2912333 RepID=UPI001964D5C6|nr:YheC/YheD family protein [Alteribacter salitolerans]
MSEKVMDMVTVGITVGRRALRNLLKQKPGFRILKTLEAGQEEGLSVFYFNGSCVNVADETIDGVYFDMEKQDWRTRAFPYPDVIYNRGGGGIFSSASSKAKEFQEQIAAQNIPSINYLKGFNKMEVYELLKKDRNLRSFLPKTKRVRNIRVLTDFFEKEDAGYVKSFNGRKGEQVIKVEKEGPSFVYRYYKEQLFTGRAATLEELYESLSGILNNKPFLIQSAIDLMRFNNRVTDMRAELQRNGDHELEIVAVCSRVSQEGSPITTHSESFRYDEFLKENLQFSEEEFLEVDKRIKAFLTDCYEVLEQHYGEVGELGIDFALDRNGRIWFIESNAHSAKVSVVKAYGDEVVEKVFKNPLRYGRSLVLGEQNKMK